MGLALALFLVLVQYLALLFVHLTLGLFSIRALALAVDLALAFFLALALSLALSSPGLFSVPVPALVVMAWCPNPVLALSMASVVHVLDGPQVWCLALTFLEPAL